MSSIYVIPNKTSLNKPIKEWDSDLDYTVIGYTSDFSYRGSMLVDYLHDDTPIVCIDNGTDITNLKELKEYYKNFRK